MTDPTISASELAMARRFWSKVDRRAPDECWPWIAGKNDGGYGVFGVNGRSTGAHRISALLSGQAIDGLMVRHKCDNPPCVNPNHLEVGTAADNCRDMWERGRQKGISAINAEKTHCDHGHLLEGRNVRVMRSGGRCCLACEREHHKAVSIQRKAERALKPKPVRPVRTHCVRGHALTPENSFRNGHGTICCHTCARGYEARYARKRGTADDQKIVRISDETMIAFVEREGVLSTLAFASRFGFSPERARRALTRLAKKGLVINEGLRWSDSIKQFQWRRAGQHLESTI